MGKGLSAWNYRRIGRGDRRRGRRPKIFRLPFTRMPDFVSIKLAYQDGHTFEFPNPGVDAYGGFLAHWKTYPFTPFVETKAKELGTTPTWVDWPTTFDVKAGVINWKMFDDLYQYYRIRGVAYSVYGYTQRWTNNTTSLAANAFATAQLPVLKTHWEVNQRGEIPPIDATGLSEPQHFRKIRTLQINRSGGTAKFGGRMYLSAGRYTDETTEMAIYDPETGSAEIASGAVPTNAWFQTSRNAAGAGGELGIGPLQYDANTAHMYFLMYPDQPTTSSATPASRIGMSGFKMTLRVRVVFYLDFGKLRENAKYFVEPVDLEVPQAEPDSGADLHTDRDTAAELPAAYPTAQQTRRMPEETGGPL